MSKRKSQRCQTKIWGSLWQRSVENTHPKGAKDCKTPGLASPGRNIFRSGAFKFHSQLNKLETGD